MADLILVDQGTGTPLILLDVNQGPAGSPGSTVDNILTITTSGTYAAVAGASYYLNLSTIGGNVTFTTGAIQSAGIGNGFYVKLVGATGGYYCQINPMVVGSHIEAVYPPSGPSLPGTLTTSMKLTLVGEDANLRNVDGTNLYTRS